MSTLRGNLFYFGLGIFGLGMNTAFLMNPFIPFELALIFLSFMAIYGVLVWTSYQNLTDLYQKQLGSESSSDGREVIPVKVIS